MRLKNFKIVLFTCFLFASCSSASTSNLNTFQVDQSPVTRKNNSVFVQDIAIESPDFQNTSVDFKLLMEPNQFGCGENFYASSENRLYYFILGEYGDYHWFIPEGIDDSHPQIHDFTYIGNCYFKNDNKIIYQGLEVKNADVKTFSNLNSVKYSINSYAVDNKNVYYAGKVVSGDANTYEILDKDYSKDKNSVYYQAKIIEGSDPATFEILGENYSKDKNSVYFHDHSEEGIQGKILNADPESFEVLYLDYHYLAKDKNHVYSFGKKTEVSDAKSFEILSYVPNNVFYAKDKNHVYFDLKKIPDVNPDTFKVLQFDYSQDEKKVFYRGKEIIYADPKTHEMMSLFYSKDQKKVFFMGKEIAGADPKTFQLVGDFHGKGHQHAFYRDEKIEGADVLTFQVDQNDKLRAHDKNFLYYEGKIVYSSDTNAPAKP